MKNKQGLFASIMLLCAALIWGASFAVMKSTLEVVSPNYILAFRFCVGAIGLFVFLLITKAKISKRDMLRGALTGLCMYSAFIIQTIGLKYIDSGKNAMLTAVYVVLVPFLVWFFKGKRPSVWAIITAFTCFLGVALLSVAEGTPLPQDESLTLLGITLRGRSLEVFGVVLTLISGMLYALHIVIVSIFSEEGKTKIMTLTFLQFLFAALLAICGALLFEEFPNVASFGTSTWAGLCYVAFLSTLIALTFQNIGVRLAPPSYAAILLCLESLFGCLFGIVIMSEPLTFAIAAGSVIIFGSVVLSELKGKE